MKNLPEIASETEDEDYNAAKPVNVEIKKAKKINQRK